MRSDPKSTLSQAVRHSLCWLSACVIAVTALCGCSTIDLPTNGISTSQMISDEEEHLSEIRKTALADPFPSAADAGLQPSED